MRMVLLFLILWSATMSFGEDSDFSPESERVIAALNIIREQHSLQPLRLDAASEKAATLHTRELEKRQTLSHWGNDGSRVAERYRRAGGTGLSAGENLGAGKSLTAIVHAWMNSPLHKKNILNPAWFSAGAWILKLPGGRMMIVVVFNNSRWQQTTFHIDRKHAILEGAFSLSRKDVPRNVFLSTGDSRITPVRVSKNKDNRIYLYFDFPRPDHWLSGELVAVEMYLFEKNTIRKTDLIFLDIP